MGVGLGVKEALQFGLKSVHGPMVPAALKSKSGPQNLKLSFIT
jgi:hypothetical protein